MQIVWGTVTEFVNRTPDSGAGYTIAAMGAAGEYSIGFRFKANTVPAIVGSQTSSGNTGEANTDGIVFPMLSSQNAVAITGDNTGAQQDRNFSFIAAGETGLAEQQLDQLILWGTVLADGTVANSSGGFTVGYNSNTPGIYQINFDASEFSTVPAIVGTQTNLGDLTEANTDGVVFPLLSASSATAVTGNNKSTIEDRTFSFIAVGTPASASSLNAKVQGQNRILWGTISADGSIISGSGGFWVGYQGPGVYVITFPSFPNAPAIVGTQTSSGSLSEDSREGMVFPWVNVNYAVAITGDGNGNQQDRSFSFIAIGEATPANPGLK